MRRARPNSAPSNAPKKSAGEARGATFIETLLQDLRYGVRTMLRAPGFTAIAMIVLLIFSKTWSSKTALSL